jgi:hypothetical protein
MATVEPVESDEPVGTPKHLWVVGILSLLWNAFGSYDYVMSQLGDAAYLESMGFGPEEVAWMDAFPLWAEAAWAVGVWLSVLGSLLLLLRSRHAAAAFALSLAGALASFAYQFTSEKPESLQGGLPAIMPAVIVVLIHGQWYYARRQQAAGVLR